MSRTIGANTLPLNFILAMGVPMHGNTWHSHQRKDSIVCGRWGGGGQFLDWVDAWQSTPDIFNDTETGELSHYGALKYGVVPGPVSMCGALPWHTVSDYEVMNEFKLNDHYLLVQPGSLYSYFAKAPHNCIDYSAKNTKVAWDETLVSADMSSNEDCGESQTEPECSRGESKTKPQWLRKKIGDLFKYGKKKNSGYLFSVNGKKLQPRNSLTDKACGVRGLVNEGNICYANAVFQFLFHMLRQQKPDIPTEIKVLYENTLETTPRYVNVYCIVLFCVLFLSLSLMMMMLILSCSCS